MRDRAQRHFGAVRNLANSYSSHLDVTFPTFIPRVSDRPRLPLHDEQRGAHRMHPRCAENSRIRTGSSHASETSIPAPLPGNPEPSARPRKPTSETVPLKRIKDARKIKCRGACAVESASAFIAVGIAVGGGHRHRHRHRHQRRASASASAESIAGEHRWPNALRKVSKVRSGRASSRMFSSRLRQA